ncbi:uncharacterized protein LOC121879753 [Homarus americanus]|uniref:Uncharacterized protein n=1 Tax=Homarus americanus TaxID=6706 RepID=A0A8J5MN84_HOMAM|nr:uncharacterized protein LOC121879753 [Homarus americanus]XP_042242457.1 uncharacterized protein LOC121879753 [Homarus americanus]KAG7157686.1 hypothetical protein Hamer_G018748 [Homarus americanus]
MRVDTLVILVLGVCMGGALVVDEHSPQGHATPPSTLNTPTTRTPLQSPQVTTSVSVGEPDDDSTNKDTPILRSTPTIRKTQRPARPPPTSPAPPTQLSLPVPSLPSQYELLVEVIDVPNNESFTVRERQRDSWASHTITADKLNVSCVYSIDNAEGFLLEGVKCRRYQALPQNCFCNNRFCRPYVALGTVLDHLSTMKANSSQEWIGGTDGKEMVMWQSREQDMVVEAFYTRTAVGLLAPLSFTVKGAGRVFNLPRGPLSLQYQVKSWALVTDPAHTLVNTAPGLFCPAFKRKFLPKLSNQFSLTMETVIENLGTIAYESQYYESEEKLVSFTYLPHLHADGMFLLSIPGLTDFTTETYRVIHDFKTGIQYMINEKTSNCTIQGIPVSALDAAPTENQHIRLRHASELIFIDPKMYLYKGTRRVRGILCDVWVAERGTRKGRYTTAELYFSHENWTVEVEVFNKVRQVPIGISSYMADNDNPSHWSSVVHTFFYEYRDGHPSWHQFDISPCLNRINRLFLKFTLEVSYSELVHYNLEAAKNSIRRAMAGIAGVSPLRVTDLFLSSRQAPGEVDVWFVLLEKPDVTGPVLTPRPQLMMADAYQLLHDITQKHNVSIKLDLSPKKKLFVVIKSGSLETTTEALHPHMRHKSMRYLKAGYTAGSMAGLGFSMAILGTCVGIFVGFLLWKRHSSVPYQVTD